MISIGLTPNFGEEEVRDCQNLKSGDETCAGMEEKLEEVIGKYFSQSVEVTESGRLAMYLLLRAWEIGKGDEVIIQAFTCSVVPTAVMALGAVPVYVDVDENYNLDLGELKNKISSKTKVVVVQHTFGKPVRMDKLRGVVPKGVKVLEDLAHGLGNSYKGVSLGKWGDGAILSFGRDKVISGVWGGAVVAEAKTIEEVKKIEQNWPRRNKAWVEKQLSYPIWAERVKKTYDWGLGKVLHWWLRRRKILSEPISKGEKKGELAVRFKGLPDELAWLGVKQWEKLGEMVQRRKEIAKLYAANLGEKYDADCSYLRYSIELARANEMRKEAAREGVFLGDWYDQVVAPKSVDPEVFGYVWGSCPKAEERAMGVVNLPTHPNMSEKDILKVISIVKKWK